MIRFLSSKFEPFYLLSLLLMIILPLISVFQAGIDHPVIYWSVLGLSAGVLVYFTTQKKVPINVDSSWLIWGLFWCWCFISILWSVNTVRTFIELIQLSLYGLIYIATKQLNKEKYDKVLNTVLIVSAAIALVGILQYLFLRTSRITSTFTNPNPFGIYLTMLLLITWGMFLTENSKRKILLALVFLTAFLLTASRASFIALALSLPILFIGVSRKNLIRKLIETLLLFLSGFLITQGVIFFESLIRENGSVNLNLIESITRTTNIVSSSEGRLAYWEIAGKLAKNRPITGYGLGTFSSAFYLEYEFNIRYSRFAHNQYLQLLSEVGIIGLALFVTFLVQSFLKPLIHTVKSKDDGISKVYLAAGFAFLLHIGVDFAWDFPAVPALFFLLIAYPYQVKHRNINVRKLTISFSCIALIFSGWMLVSSQLITGSIKAYQNNSTKGIEMIDDFNHFNLLIPYPFSLQSDWLIAEYSETKEEQTWQNAYDCANKALTKAPYRAEYLSQMGLLFELKQDFITAESFYKKAVQYSAYNVNTFLELGNFYRRINKSEKAILTYENFVSLQHYAVNEAKEIGDNQAIVNMLLIHLHLSKLYKNQGAMDESLQHLDEAAKLVERFPFLEKYYYEK